MPTEQRFSSTMARPIATADPATSKTNSWVLVVGLLVVIIAILGLVFYDKISGLLSNSVDTNETSTPSPATTAKATASARPTATPGNDGTASPTPTASATPIATTDGDITIEKPTTVADTQLITFFPKPAAETGANTLGFTLREKPASGSLGFIIGEFFKGPNAEDKAAGLTSQWKFTDSKCSSTNTYSFKTVSGKIRIELCKTLAPTTEGGARLFAEGLKNTFISNKLSSGVYIYYPDNVCAIEGYCQE